ncbi:MAG: type III secretion system stator protein SctL [Deltaproteobacteria bacterium]|nr:type III secretion system stator protein SctL [Deltaproteobacteria bacterium]
MSKIVKHADLEKKMGLGGQVAPRSVSSMATPLGMRNGVISKAELSSQDKAVQILTDAQQEATKIRQEAEHLLSQVKEETEKAKAKGYEEGRAEGMGELTAEVLKARKLKEEFFATAEPDIIKLVLSIAEKVLGKLVEEHKETVLAIVRQALEKTLGDRITIRINPEDLKRLRAEDLQFKDLLDRTRQLHFKEDEAIQKGGCIVETEIGTIDAQLETQLKAIRKALGV